MQDEEFAFNLRRALGAPTSGSSNFLKVLTAEPGAGQKIPLAGPAEVMAVFFKNRFAYWNAENHLIQCALFVRIFVDFLSLMLLVLLWVHDQHVLFQGPMSEVHWIGWIAIGLYGVVEILSFLANQFPRLYYYKSEYSGAWDVLGNVLDGLLIRRYRSRFSSILEAVVVTFVVVVCGVATLTMLVHSITHLLLWQLSGLLVYWFVAFNLSVLLSSLADACAHGEYVKMYEGRERSILIHRLSCWRTSLGFIVSVSMTISVLWSASARE